MFKSIPKSSISKRQFKTYKEWRVDNTEYPVISASLDNSLHFIEETEVSSSVGNTILYNKPLYKSIRSKYYSDKNIQNIFGVVQNTANFNLERRLSNTIRIISLDRNKIGEQIKLGSVYLEDIDNNLVYTDDGYGRLTIGTYDYPIQSVDIENETLIITDDDDSYELTIISIDYNSGELVALYDGLSYTFIIEEFDFQENLIKLQRPIEDSDLAIPIQSVNYGNVFYDEGLIVFTNETSFQNYNLVYNSTQTIHETEVLVNVDEGEFNYSQNPTAAIILLSGSYNFETTAITNFNPPENVRIKHIYDIKLKQSFSSSYNPSITGSWDDYQNYRWSDPTGSYLTPYITTIGLYDDDYNMIAVAKLPTPIKSYPDLPLNFLIRFDT